MTTSEKCQKSLLGGLEKFWGANQNLIPTVPKVLMVLYQEDILDEEVIESWGTHVSKKYVDKETSKKVRKASEPLLKVSRLLWAAGFGGLSTDIHVSRSGLPRPSMTMMRRASDFLPCYLYLSLPVSISSVRFMTFPALLDFQFLDDPGDRPRAF
jgi:hypothetical protein